jgi:hypothetical protein
MNITRPTLTDNDTLTAAQANLLFVQALEIAAREVTPAKMAAVNPGKLLGRFTAGAGDMEEADVSANGLALVAASNPTDARAVLNCGTLATQNADNLDVTGGKAKLANYAAAPGADLTGGTVALDLAPTVATWQTVAVNGNLTLTTANREAGRVKFIRLVGDGNQRTVNPAAWKWVNCSAPTVLPAGKTAILILWCFGTAETDVVASWGVQP